jgi:hypothetical protein
MNGETRSGESTLAQANVVARFGGAASWQAAPPRPFLARLTGETGERGGVVGRARVHAHVRMLARRSKIDVLVCV